MSNIQNASLQPHNANVIKVVPSKFVKDISFVDSQFISNMDLADTTVKLGLVNTLEASGFIKVPLLTKIWQNADVINVNGRVGKFQYETLLSVDQCNIVQELYDPADKLGYKGVPFKFKSNLPFRQGDIITTQVYTAIQFSIVEDSEVVNEGDGFVHTAEISISDDEAFIPAAYLSQGTKLMKIGSTMGEFSENAYSAITGGATPSKMVHEFVLGSEQGVEVTYTAYGMDVTLDGKSDGGRLQEQLMNKAKSLGYNGDEIIITNGKELPNNKLAFTAQTRLDKLMNILAMSEILDMTSKRMMWAQGATYNSINGVKRVSEGFYPQMRRGHRFTYANNIELKQAIQKAVDVLYSNNYSSTIQVEDRYITMEGGFEAITLVRQMFKEQFDGNNIAFVDQKLLPFPVLEGKDRHNLAFRTFAIKTAFVPGIGNLTVNHEPAFDYDFGDLVQSGFNRGRSDRSWSLAIWDTQDAAYSNAHDSSVLPKGVEIDPAAKNKNFFLVKPQGVPDISFGYERGRVTGTNVHSVNRKKAETFWATSQMDGFIMNPNRVILIEKANIFNQALVKFL